MQTQHPDIVLLVLDTQRADRLSCYGHPGEISPFLDELAAESTRFQNAVAAAQWTIPSHASMFTGVYPRVHNTVQSYSVLPPSLPTVAERLRDAGYYTAAFCNNPLVGVINNGLRRGFYSFLNYSGLLTSRPNQAGIPSNWLDRYRQEFKRLLAGLLNQVQDTFARSEAMLALSFTPIMVPLWQTALSFKGNTAKSLNDTARLLIERRGVSEGQPIFSFINLMGTHMPYHPPRRFTERFAPHVLRDKEAQRYLRQFNSDIYGWLAPLADPLDEEHKATLDGMYDAEVAAQDEQVGLFLNKLREHGRLDRTLFIVCADHGEHLGEKRLLGHTNALYNELVQVPLLIRDPSGDFPRGTSRQEVVSTRRLFHTILNAAGCASEAEAALSLARDSAAEEAVFAEAVPPQNVLNLLLKRQPELVREHECDKTALAVWSEQYKFLTTVRDWQKVPAPSDRQELYNIFEDPKETLNLRDILPEQVEMLSDCLQALIRQTPVTPTVAEAATNYNDPQVYRRLRDLGYLE
jgi:arylsulfatase A-like enzyme